MRSGPCSTAHDRPSARAAARTDARRSPSCSACTSRARALHAAPTSRSTGSARAREVQAEQEGERRASVLAAARAEGRSWAVLQGPERIEELYGGSTVTTHLATGRTLLAAVDPYAGTEPYLLREFAADGAPAREQAFADPTEWVAQRDRWRREIEST